MTSNSSTRLSFSPKTPVVFDIVMNIENLYSISSIQEEMEIATAYYRSLGENDSLVEEFEVIDVVKVWQSSNLIELNMGGASTIAGDIVRRCL